MTVVAGTQSTGKIVRAGQLAELVLEEVFTDASGQITTKDSLRLTPSFGAIYYRDLDLGFPAVRAVSQELAGADGTYDETRYHGARSVALTLFVRENAFKKGNYPGWENWNPAVGWNDPNYWVSLLGSWAYAGRRNVRLYLRWRQSNVKRYLDIVPSGFSAPRTMAERGGISVQLQWSCPSGFMYSFDESPLATSSRYGSTKDGRTLIPVRLQAAAQPGRAYPGGGRTEPRVYPAAYLGSDSAIYKGTVPNGFTVRFYAGSSSLVNPRLTVAAPDGSTQVVGFDRLTLAANTYVDVDTVARKATSSAGVDVANKLGSYSWPRLQPGFSIDPDNPMRATPGYNHLDFSADGSPATNARADIMWHDAFIS